MSVDALRAGQNAALERLARGGSIDEVLGALIATFEQQSAGRFLGGFALLNEAATEFTGSVGEAMPASYHRAVIGMPVSSRTGSCCHAVLERKEIVIPDVTADPQWARFAAFIAPLGLRAAWSVPVTGSGGAILATFANYAREPREPTWEERWFVEGIAHTAALAIERKRAEEAQREAERHKDEFLAILAHELRNPLAPLRNGLHLLRLSAPGSEPAEQARAMMERQLGHLIRLVDDLLEVSRISRGKIELRCAPTELAAAVLSAVETSRPAIEAARHRLDISLPAEPLMLHADFVRLAQVVSNLLNNAAKYTEPGGSIALAVKREGAEALISVRDDGVGIPAALLPRVFDLFAQADRGRAQGGLGIGLAIAKSLVELHGGRIEVQSPGAGRGSEFTVRLPLAAQPALAAPGVEAAA